MPMYTQLALQIIKAQERIIGPVAWDEARNVAGLRVIDVVRGEVVAEGSGKEVLEQLVLRYEALFGRAAREICRAVVAEASKNFPVDDLPEVLR